MLLANNAANNAIGGSGSGAGSAEAYVQSTSDAHAAQVADVAV